MAASHPSDYARLSRDLRRRGLFRKQPFYYAGKIAVTAVLFLLGIVMLAVVDNPWLKLVDAVYLGFVWMQWGFIGHDAGHHQIFSTPRHNTWAGLLIGNVLLGISHSWWVSEHNRHHRHPNQIDRDPDLANPFLVFSEEQTHGKRGLPGVIAAYQDRLFFPLLVLEAFNLRLASIRYLMRGESRAAAAESLLCLIHFIGYAALLACWVGGSLIVPFLIVHQAAFGLYAGSVFAVNHKGMRLFERERSCDVLRYQVTTARNIRAHGVTDWWYGGLNYQIEHHLFPSIPRNKLREAQRLVKAHCRTNGIPYHEVTIGQSYREVLAYLHQVSAPLRGTTGG